MSDINEERIRELGRLCRIEISEDELKPLAKDMKKVLDYVELLREVDVSHLSPFYYLNKQGIDTLREDVIEETLPRDYFLSNSPDQIGGMIRVPPVMKQQP